MPTVKLNERTILALPETDQPLEYDAWFQHHGRHCRATLGYIVVARAIV